MGHDRKASWQAGGWAGAQAGRRIGSQIPDVQTSSQISNWVSGNFESVFAPVAKKEEGKERVHRGKQKKEGYMKNEVIGRAYKIDIPGKEPSVAGMGPEKLFPTRFLPREISQLTFPNVNHLRFKQVHRITDYRYRPNKNYDSY